MERKVVLVTGASSGIGKATALWLKKEGYSVYGAARRVEKMKKELAAHDINVLYLDLTDEKAIVKCVDSIIKKEGRIDILINNAVYANFGTIEESSLDIARAHYEVNVFGFGKITQLVIPHMRENKFGKIVNLSSGAGKVAGPFNGWYGSTKFAIEALSDTMRLELKPFGIDVIVIEPGAIRTPIAKELVKSALKNSGHGVYARSAKKFSNTVNSLYVKGSSPDVIAKTISKAIKAKNPKTRYAAGYWIKGTLFMRKVLPDKLFDKIILRYST